MPQQRSQARLHSHVPPPQAPFFISSLGGSAPRRTTAANFRTMASSPRLLASSRVAHSRRLSAHSSISVLQSPNHLSRLCSMNPRRPPTSCPSTSIFSRDSIPLISWCSLAILQSPTTFSRVDPAGLSSCELSPARASYYALSLSFRPRPSSIFELRIFSAQALSLDTFACGYFVRAPTFSVLSRPWFCLHR